MTTSQNGWPVITDRNHCTHFSAAGRDWYVANEDVATIFGWLIWTYDETVESVTKLDTELDDWSWANRDIRGSTTAISNHASGTAIDINADRHPRGEHGTFSGKQITAIRNILKYLNKDSRCVRWGGDYIKAPVDGMHFEILCSEHTAHLLATRIRKDMNLTTQNLRDIGEAVWSADTIPNKETPKDPEWRADNVLGKTLNVVDALSRDMENLKADMAKILTAMKVA